MATDATAMGTTFVQAVRANLAEGLEKIQHCVGQLDESQVWWRPFEAHNSVANILQHLAGNLQQWIISGVGGAPDVRNRPGEFADRSGAPKAELLDRLAKTVAECDAILDRLAPDDLLVVRRIQGFDLALLTAIYDTSAHFRGHVQEITYITRMLVGPAYRFFWVPQGPEQVSAGQ